MPAELRTGEYAAEPVLDGLWALYGEMTNQGITIRPWTMLLGDQRSRAALQTLAAASTLGDDFTYGHMMRRMGEMPIFTNEEFHPQIAAALLMPAEWWCDLRDAIKPRPRTLLAMIPSPSCMFITPIDEPTMIAAVDVYWRWKLDALMTTTAIDIPANRTQHLSDGLANVYRVGGNGSRDSGSSARRDHGADAHAPSSCWSNWSGMTVEART